MRAAMLGLIVVISLPNPGSGQRAPIEDSLRVCAGEANDPARLACYDRAAGRGLVAPPSTVQPGDTQTRTTLSPVWGVNQHRDDFKDTTTVTISRSGSHEPGSRGIGPSLPYIRIFCTNGSREFYLDPGVNLGSDGVFASYRLDGGPLQQETWAPAVRWLGTSPPQDREFISRLATARRLVIELLPASDAPAQRVAFGLEGLEDVLATYSVCGPPPPTPPQPPPTPSRPARR